MMHENSKALQKSAKAFMKKEETKMNIRISASELQKIKEKCRTWKD